MMGVMLFGHSADPDNMFWITMLWGYLIYITVVFLYTFISKLPMRHTDPWIIFDFFLIGLMSYYLFYHAAEHTTDHSDFTPEEINQHKRNFAQRRAIINLNIWIRMISFLRFFSTTRIFIFMLIEVINDMAGFMIILCLFLAAFASIKLLETR